MKRLGVLCAFLRVLSGYPSLNVKLLTSFFLLFLTFAANSQFYPVLVNTSIRAPYSLNLSDYASPTYDRLQSNVYLADLSKTNYAVKFRLLIQGPGISMSTVPGQEIGPFYLNGGQTTILTGADLNQLFNPDKLNFAGISRQQYKQNASVPEGIYQIQFEVLDFNFGSVVSNANVGYATAWLILNDPPLINVPERDATIIPLSQQNIFFQWTPRHTGSPNSAFTTVYDLQMVEIYPAGRNANDAMLTSPLIFEKTVYSTSYNYNVVDPYLQPDRWYAFRVRARDLNGLDLFKNQGYSEVYRFYYGQPCLVPAELKFDPISNSSVLLYWTEPSAYTSVEVQYKTAQGGSWNSVLAYENKILIEKLTPGKEYVFRLIGNCAANSSGRTEEFPYTPTGTGTGVPCELPIPESITVTLIYSGNVKLDWTTQPWFDRYILLYREAGTGNYKEIATNTTSVALSDLHPGKRYEYQLRYHCNMDRWINGTPGTFFVGEPVDPGTGNCFPPLDITHAVNKDLSVTISWPKDKEVNAYHIYYREVGAARWDSLAYVKQAQVTIKKLKAGSEYEYCIKAICKDGKLSIASAKNYFRTEYTSPAVNCKIPELLAPTILSKDQVKLEWKADSSFSAYVLEYRVQKTSNWVAIRSTVNTQVVKDLESAKKYEYRVYAFCGQKSSEYSRVDTFSTAGKVQNPFVCGSNKALENISNRTPVATLNVGDTFTAADFELVVKSLTKPTAPYNGEAIVKIPYFGYSRFTFEMENVRINELGQVYEGKVYLKALNLDVIDPAMAEKINEILEKVDGGFTSMEEYLNKVEEYENNINLYISQGEGGNNVGFVKTGEVEVTATIHTSISDPSQIKGTKSSNGDCSLSITGDDGKLQTLTVTPPAIIKDDKGMLFSIDNTCAANRAGEIINIGGNPEEFNTLSTNVTVKFEEHPSQKFGFSAWNTKYANSTEWTLRYQLLGTSYRVNTKFMEPAATDKVKATISISDNTVDKSKLIFATSKGVKFTSRYISGNDYEITVIGGPEGDAQELYALYPLADGSYESFGKLLVASYKHKKRTMILVPVNGVAVPAAEIKAKLNAVYNPYGVEWDVTTAASFNDKSWDLNSDNALEVEGSGAFSTLTPEMKALNGAYVNSGVEIDPTSIYLFVLNKAATAGVDGDMPRTKQFGYLFVSGNRTEEIALTAAHEAGHGLFLLRHIFDGYGMEEKSLPDNLMDYAGGSMLAKIQWDIIHDPGKVLGVFERDEDSKSMGRSRISAEFANPDQEKTFTFITPAGTYITLPNKVYNILFQYGMNSPSYQVNCLTGALLKFSLLSEKNEELIYKASFAKRGNKEWEFSGYDLQNGSDLTPISAKQYYPDKYYGSFILYYPVHDKYILASIKTSARPVPYKNETLPVLEEKLFPFLPFLNCIEDRRKEYSLQGVDVGNDQIQPNVEILKMITIHENRQEFFLLLKIAQMRTMYPELFNKFTLYFDDWKDVTFPGAAEWDLKVFRDVKLRDKWKSNPVEFYDQFIDEFYAFILKENDIKKDRFRLALESPPFNQDEAFLALNLFSDNEIRELDINTRIRAIGLLAANGPSTPANYEKQIVRLVKHTPWDQSDLLLEKIQQNNPIIEELKPFTPGFQSKILLYQLVKGVDDNAIGFGEENYKGLTIAFIEVCNRSEAFFKKAKQFEDDYKNFNKHTAIFNYTSVWKSAAIETAIYFSPGLVELMGGSLWRFDTDVELVYNTSAPVSADVKVFQESCFENKPCQTIQQGPFNAFEPVWVSNNSTLSILKDLSGPQGAWLPAVFLNYADDKGDYETASDLTNAAIDGIGLFTGVTEIRAGLKGVKLAMALADVAGSSVSLIDNLTDDAITRNIPVLKNVSDAMGNLLGAVGIADMIRSGFTANRLNDFNFEQTYSIASAHSNVDAAQIKNLSAAYLTALENATDDIVSWNLLSPKGKYDHEVMVGYLAIQARIANETALVTRCQKAIEKIRISSSAMDGYRKIGLDLNHLGEIKKQDGAVIARIENGTLKLEPEVNIDLSNVTNDNSVLVNNVNKIELEGISYDASDVRFIMRADGKYTCVGEGAFCFTAGTLVHKKEKPERIENLQKGDTIVAFNHSTRSNVYSVVSNIFKKNTRQLIRLIVGTTLLWATPEHPLYANGQYVPAKQLQPGDTILTIDGQYAIVKQTKVTDTITSVYNIEVEGQHNYFVGIEGLLVHNSCALKTIYSVLGGNTTAFKDKLRTLSFYERNAAINRLVDESTKDGILDQGLLKAKVDEFVRESAVDIEVFLKGPYVETTRQEVLSKKLNELYPKNSIEEITAIRYYTGTGHNALNAQLRSKIIDDFNRAFDYLLMNGLKKLERIKASPVRGCGETESKFWMQFKDGDEVLLPDYTSTTNSITTAKDFMNDRSGNVIILIDDAEGYDLKPFSEVYTEDEILLLRKAKFRVIGEPSLRGDNDTPYYIIKIKFLGYD